jgi:small subunit ribosomal protein S4e
MKTKRIAAPRTWPLQRKHGKWVTSPKSAHRKDECVPLTIILKDFLELCVSTREVKKLVAAGKVMINKRRVKSYAAGVGLFDVVELEGVNKAWRLVYDETRKFTLITCKDADKKLFKVMGKTALPKGFQLNLSGGANIVSMNKKIKTGDSLLLSLPDYKIITHLSPVKGSRVYITGGSHLGELAKIKKVEQFEGLRQDMFHLKSGTKEFQTIKHNVFVVGKTKEAIKIT